MLSSFSYLTDAVAPSATLDPSRWTPRPSRPLSRRPLSCVARRSLGWRSFLSFLCECRSCSLFRRATRPSRPVPSRLRRRFVPAPLHDHAVERQAADPSHARRQIIGPDLSVRLQCPECAPRKPEIIEEFGSGDLVCGGCGLVLGDRIVDTRSEWRVRLTHRAVTPDNQAADGKYARQSPQTFANDEGDDPSRVGSASNPLDGPETFETGISFRDGNTGLSRELQRAAFKASTKSEKTLSTAYTDIGALTEKISLGKGITDTAKQLFKRASEEGVLKGKPQEAVIAACIFIACRMGNSPRTFKEICVLTQVPKKLLGQCYKALERAFEVKASGGGSVDTSGAPAATPPAAPTPPASARDSAAPLSAEALAHAENSSETRVISQMLPRFISNLGLSQTPGFQSACLHILIAGKALGLIDGRSPLTVVGSLLYFASHLWGVGKSAKEVCAVVDTTESTIRGRYKVLVEERERLVKKEWVESGIADFARLPN